MDTETDSLIQETIRNSFQDCTTLTIAHRLHTVLNCDRIMVLNQGQVNPDKPSVRTSQHDLRLNINLDCPFDAGGGIRRTVQTPGQ